MGALAAIDVPRDPATIGYPPTLPIELALKTAPLARLREEYGFSEAEWDALRYDPNFLKDLTAAVELVRKEGMSFRLKARLQAEELLKSSWRMIHDDLAPASVRADLIKATMRWAGYEAELKATGTASANNLQININLG